RRRVGTGRSTTSARASRSCGTTGGRCSCPPRSPRARPRRRPARQRLPTRPAGRVPAVTGEQRTYTKQEQEPATDEITELAPGVLRTQLPVELPGLGHVNCYLLEDERGVAVVDPGLPGPASWQALLD